MPSDLVGFHEVKAQRLSALKVLGSFDFGDHNLLEFVSSHVVPLMRSSPELSLRQAAAKACVIFVSRHILENKSSSESSKQSGIYWISAVHCFLHRQITHLLFIFCSVIAVFIPVDEKNT